MIHLITWNTNFLLKWEILRWKKWFKLKYSEAGITHIQNPDASDLQFIRDTILSRSFLSAKKLLILEDLDLWNDFCEELYEILKKKDDDCIVLLSISSVDKRLLGYKNLKKIITKHEDFNLAASEDAYAYLQKVFGQSFYPWALKYLFERKWENFSKSFWEAQKLVEIYQKVDIALIDSIIIPELESTIFKLLDAYLLKHAELFFTLLSQVLVHENFYLISQWFLSNLRTHLYIEYLKSLWKKSSDISDILKLWNKNFLIGKKHARNFKEIFWIFQSLMDFDKNMKQGKLWVSSDEDLKKLYRTVFLQDFT